MGMYDYVINGETIIQIKCAECTGETYTKGGYISVKDGLYIAYEGAFVVRNRLITEVIDEKDIYTKWGSKLDLEKTLNSYNIIAEVTNSYEARRHFGLV